MRARIEASSFTPLCQPPNKQLQRTVTRNRGRAVGGMSLCAYGALDSAARGR